MRQAEHHVRLPGWAWSLVLAAGAAVQASSYLTRPPENGAVELLETVLHYDGWAAILLAGAAMVAAGIGLWLAGSDWAPWLAFAGHIVLLGTVAIFATSSTMSVFTDPAMGWSGATLLAICCVLHTERILCIGTNIGRR